MERLPNRTIIVQFHKKFGARPSDEQWKLLAAAIAQRGDAPLDEAALRAAFEEVAGGASSDPWGGLTDEIAAPVAPQAPAPKRAPRRPAERGSDRSGIMKIVAIVAVVALGAGGGYYAWDSMLAGSRRDSSSSSALRTTPAAVTPERTSAAAPTSAPTAAPPVNMASDAAIEGTYYFRGMRLLEVRREGDAIVTELEYEREVMAQLFGIMRPPRPAPGRGRAGADTNADAERNFRAAVAQYRHRGKSVAPGRVEFAKFDATMPNLLNHFGLSDAALPAETLAQINQRFAGVSLGQYHETWIFPADGTIRIDCALPSPLPILNDRMETGAIPLQELMQRLSEGGAGGDLFAELRARYPADAPRVWGWKIDHAHELAGWEALRAGDHAAAAQKFHAAAQAQPQSPFPCLAEAWSRAGTGEFDLARAALQAGRDRMNNEARPYLSGFSQFLEDQIDSYETASLGAAADWYAFSMSLRDTPSPSDSRLAELRRKPPTDLTQADYAAIQQAVQAFPLWERIRQSSTMRGRGPLLPIGPAAFSPELVKYEVPNFLNLQQLAGMVVLNGHLQRSRGRLTDAANQYALAAHLGQMSRHGVLISSLVGIANEAMGLNALAALFEDGLLTDATTVGIVSQFVSWLNDQEPRGGPEAMFALEFHFNGLFVTSDPIISSIVGGLANPNFQEAETRKNATLTQLELIRGACAVKAQSARAPYPASLGAAALPADPFAPGQPLRYRAEGDGFILWSVGPDGIDDSAATAYEPRNGTISSGDVFLRGR